MSMAACQSTQINPAVLYTLHPALGFLKKKKQKLLVLASLL